MMDILTPTRPRKSELAALNTSRATDMLMSEITAIEDSNNHRSLGATASGATGAAQNTNNNKGLQHAIKFLRSDRARFNTGPVIPVSAARTENLRKLVVNNRYSAIIKKRSKESIVEKSGKSDLISEIKSGVTDNTSSYLHNLLSKKKAVFLDSIASVPQIPTDVYKKAVFLDSIASVPQIPTDVYISRAGNSVTQKTSDLLHTILETEDRSPYKSKQKNSHRKSEAVFLSSVKDGSRGSHYNHPSRQSTFSTNPAGPTELKPSGSRQFQSQDIPGFRYHSNGEEKTKGSVSRKTQKQLRMMSTVVDAEGNETQPRATQAAGTYRKSYAYQRFHMSNFESSLEPSDSFTARRQTNVDMKGRKTRLTLPCSPANMVKLLPTICTMPGIKDLEREAEDAIKSNRFSNVHGMSTNMYRDRKKLIDEQAKIEQANLDGACARLQEFKSVVKSVVESRHTI